MKGNVHTEQFVIMVVSVIVVLTLIIAIGTGISDSILSAVESSLQ